MRLSILALALAVVACAEGSARRHAHARRDGTVTYQLESSVVAGSSITLAPTSSSSGIAGVPRPASVSLPQPPSPAPTSPPSPTPTPLDTTISSTLSSPCMVYLTSLLSSADFLACLPFSLLLWTSNGYKSAVATATQTGNYIWVNQLVGYTASPAPGSATCDARFASYLEDMKKKSNCGNDLGDQKPVARAARRGIGNYAVMRTASALTNPATGVYCYLDAIATDRPDDLYLWMLAGGNILPATSTPTCSQCSGLLMNHLTGLAGNSSSLNSTTIGAAARAINAKCGASFVDTAGLSVSRAQLVLPPLALTLVGLFTWAFLA